MTYFDSEKNESIKQEIKNDITWYDQKNEDFKNVLNSNENKGLYFLERENLRKSYMLVLVV